MGIQHCVAWWRQVFWHCEVHGSKSRYRSQYRTPDFQLEYPHISVMAFVLPWQSLTKLGQGVEFYHSERVRRQFGYDQGTSRISHQPLTPRIILRAIFQFYPRGWVRMLVLETFLYLLMTISSLLAAHGFAYGSTKLPQ